jgi:hypothetical protein
LIVKGGVGIGTDLHVGGILYGTVSGSITTATNISGGVAGQIHIQTSNGITGFIGTSTQGSLLQMGVNTAAFASTSTIIVGFAATATSAATAYALANTGTTYVYRATLADSATTATSAATAYALVNTSTLVVGFANTATTATNAAFAYSFSTTTNVLSITSSSGSLSTLTGNALYVAGGIGVEKSVSVGTVIKTSATIIANLPSAADAGVGARSFITDASTNTFATLVSTTGTYKVPVYSDGTSWYIG